MNDTHPEFRYDSKRDIVMVHRDITGYWQVVQDPEGGSWCPGCAEVVAVPPEHRRP